MARKAPLEKTVQRNILKYLNSLDGCRARSHTASGPYNQSGEPDIDAVLKGRSLKLEVKRHLPSKAQPLFRTTAVAFVSRGATPLQAQTLEEWAKAGAIAAVVTSVDEVRELLAPYTK